MPERMQPELRRSSRKRRVPVQFSPSFSTGAERVSAQGFVVGSRVFALQGTRTKLYYPAKIIELEDLGAPSKRQHLRRATASQFAVRVRTKVKVRFAGAHKPALPKKPTAWVPLDSVRHVAPCPVCHSLLASTPRRDVRGHTDLVCIKCVANGRPTLRSRRKASSTASFAEDVTGAIGNRSGLGQCAQSLSLIHI